MSNISEKIDFLIKAIVLLLKKIAILSDSMSSSYLLSHISELLSFSHFILPFLILFSLKYSCKNYCSRNDSTSPSLQKIKKEIVYVHWENKVKLDLRQSTASCQTLLGILCSRRPWAVSDPWNRGSISAKGTVHLFIWNSLKTMSRRKEYGSLICWYSLKNSHVPCIERSLSRKLETLSSTHNRKNLTQENESWKVGDLRTQSGSMKQQYQLATAFCKPEERKGMVPEPRAWGHQAKAGFMRKAQALSEMQSNAKREENYPAEFLPSSCPPISCKCHPSTETGQRGDDIMESWECNQWGHTLQSTAKQREWEDGSDSNLALDGTLPFSLPLFCDYR